MSAVRDSLFNIFAAAVHIGSRSSVRSLSIRHAVVTGTHLSWRNTSSFPRTFCCVYRGADKSLARPTSRCVLFDGENISFEASLFIYINSNNILPNMIINRIYLLTHLLTYLLTPCSRVLLEKLTGSAASQEIPRILEPEGSSPYPQVPATCPYPEPPPSSPRNPRPLPEDPS